MSDLTMALWQVPQPDAGPGQMIERLAGAMEAASQARAQVLLTPELCLTGYGDRAATLAGAISVDGPQMAQVCAVVRRSGLGLVLGFAEREEEQVYNSAAVIAPSVDIIGVYRKRQLPNAYEAACFARGAGPLLVDLCGVRVSVLICYDVEFPEYMREAALGGAQVVLVPTALGQDWAVVSEAVVPARAYENGIFVAYCNFAHEPDRRAPLAGLSVLCGPDGNAIARAGRDEALLVECLDMGAIEAARAKVPFLVDCPK